MELQLGVVLSNILVRSNPMPLPFPYVTVSEHMDASEAREFSNLYQNINSNVQSFHQLELSVSVYLGENNLTTE